MYNENGLVFLGDRIVVPTNLRKAMLEKLHESHIGITKTKLRARGIFYWPGIDTDIENFISRCRICEKFQPLNSKEPLIPHEVPSLPFEKIGCDICQVEKDDFLIVTDYFSKWIEIIPIKTKQSLNIIECLKTVFATHGIPKTIICDNMPFASNEFAKFSQIWNFVIKTSSPTYARSNGQAEKAVHIAKMLIKKAREDGKDLNYALLEYRNHPVSQLGVSPSQVLLSRRTRTKIPIKDSLLQPKLQLEIETKLHESQRIVKTYHDQTAKYKSDLSEGDNVVYRRNGLWQSAHIVRKHESPRSYIIKNENQNLLRRNRSHLRKSFNIPTFRNRNNVQIEPDPHCNDNINNNNNQSLLQNQNHNELSNIQNNINNGVSFNQDNNAYVTRSGRVSRPPCYLQDYV